jgi:piezo-type mechanosensitive ion channel component 1/2
MLFLFVFDVYIVQICGFVQAWSVIYHSWLAFVLLIAACLIWIVPQKRNLCLRCSPCIVFYAVCLLTIQYIYGFNLNDEELPTFVAGYHLGEIGLVKYQYPVGPLALQVCLWLSFLIRTSVVSIWT